MSGRDEDPKPTSQEQWERFIVALFRNRIEHCCRLYTRSGNPIHALQAYRMARAAKIDIPGWTLELFDQWAETLCVKPPKKAQEIAPALGLAPEGGGPSIFSQAEKQARNHWIAVRVLRLRELDPNRGIQDIFLQVAEEYEISSERVSGIWYDLTHRVIKSS